MRLAHTRPGPARRGRDGERGAVLLLVAFGMVSLLLMTAIVIDLGYARGSAGMDQSTVDLAALAGGYPLVQKRYPEACKAIVYYVNVNARGGGGIDADNFCTGWDTTVCSTGGTVAQVVSRQTAGPYTVELRFPVPDAEIADPTFGAGTLDGYPCERIRVSITSREPSFFGGVVGKKYYDVTRTAVVRGGASQTRLVPALWLLDPVGCPALTVQGGSQLTAGDVSNPNDIKPGVITLDSDGSSGCSTTNPTISAGGNGTQIRAVPTSGVADKIGQISLRALPPFATACTGSVACIQSDIGPTNLIYPQPQPARERATRAPVDWAWNCKASYPDYKGIAVAPCPYSDQLGPYIDNLIASVGTTGTPWNYTRWSTQYSCSPSGVINVPAGNWLIDCGSWNIGSGTTITFAGGNIIANGGWKLTNNGTININQSNPNATLASECKPPRKDQVPCISQSSSRAAFLYFRSGDLEFNGGTFNAHRTAVYLTPGGVLKGTGGSPPTWTAPSEGPLAGLSLWAESSGSMTMSGGAGVSLQGTFFTPYSDLMTLTGGGNWGQQNAQFIAYRLKVSGGSILNLAPDPTSAIQMPPEVATLIR